MTEWSVEPKKLLEILSVLDLVPCRPGIPSSVFMQLEEKKGRLTACMASDVSGVVSVAGSGGLELKGPIHLDRRLFLPFVFAAKTYKSDKPFVFKRIEKQMFVQQGRRKATFDSVSTAAGYGSQQPGEGTVLPITDGVQDSLKIAAACATTDPSVPELNCVYTVRTPNGLGFYASNQLVVLRGAEKAKGKFPEKLAFPLFLVPFLSADGLKEVHLKEKEVSLKFNCGTVWQGVSVKAQKAFPRETMDQLMKDGSGWTEQFSLATRRLGSVTERFSQYLTAVRRQDWLLRLRATEGDKQIALEVKIPQGVFREKVALESPAQSDFDVDWPLDILLPLFEYLHKQKDGILSVRFEKKTPYLLTCGKLAVVVTRRKK